MAMTTVGDPGTVLICGNHFDGRSDALSGPSEILVRDGMICELATTVTRAPGARTLDLGARTATPCTSKRAPRTSLLTPMNARAG